MELSGTILITGEHGVGKTSFALEGNDPARIHFVDDDLKGRGTIAQLKQDKIEFGQYTDFIEMTRGKKRLDVHKAGLKLIHDIKPGQFDCLIWDTWTRFEETFHSYIQANPNEFRDPDGWAAMGKIRSGEEYKESRIYEANVIAELQSKVPLVILVSHLKNFYQNNVATGKQIPAVSPAVLRVCSLRMWLRHNPEGSTPIGLVLKNIDRKIVQEETGRLRTVQVLPMKITPQEGEFSVWDSISRYYENPFGLQETTHPWEVPNDFEMSLITGTLTPDQQLSWLHALKGAKESEEEEAILKTQGIIEAWQSGEYEKKKDLADALGFSMRDVLAALRDLGE